LGWVFVSGSSVLSSVLLSGGARVMLGVYEADTESVATLLPPGVTCLEDPAVCIAWVCNYPFTSFGPYNEAIMLIRVEFEGEAYSYCPFIYIDGEAPLGVRSEAGVRSSPT
jgi:acetoacetate decarboxylase